MVAPYLHRLPLLHRICTAFLRITFSISECSTNITMLCSPIKTYFHAFPVTLFSDLFAPFLHRCSSLHRICTAHFSRGAKTVQMRILLGLCLATSPCGIPQCESNSTYFWSQPSCSTFAPNLHRGPFAPFLHRFLAPNLHRGSFAPNLHRNCGLDARLCLT